ncbi:glycoside hydrolase superfamily [Ustulina deusta]|nr:glycoside hydrolase superfamily [Ustulina deusta]
MPWMKGLVKRADCKTEKVEFGDSCESLAKKCGISGDDFTKYNNNDTCSTLAPGGIVCCSEGDLPDIRPKPESNGTCAQSDIEDLNKVKTWGFNSCENLGLGLRICLSKGDAPLPAPNKNAICGPTVPGTKPPTGNQTFADLNPCPLNACCNVWGLCGVSGEFCTQTKGEFGNPGAGPKGNNGCSISCGRDIKNNDEAPASFIKVGYYESWNMDRPCLKLKAKSLASMGKSYTHIHWGFGKISEDLDVSIDDKYGQWNDFKSLQHAGIKTILSMGGPDGREHFTDSLVKLVKDQGISGVDIDWEYPGDGDNYLEMLKLLRKKLGSSFSLSIAAPASYWYLRPFPIDAMAEYLDYIIYMTYDLHGQWDTGNKWAQLGCPEGNCLRITKAGVSSKKIVVGISSYGRSFKMTDPSCSGSSCTFGGTNTNSTAKPGECTQTRGYLSNAEINRIIAAQPDSKHWYDNEVDADFLVYDW